MEVLKNAERIKNYGDASLFPDMGVSYSQSLALTGNNRPSEVGRLSEK